MVLNKDGIKRTRDSASYSFLSPSYNEAVLDCAKVGAYSSVWTIIGLSNVLDLPIRTIYPAVNNSKHDLAVVKFNTTFYPKCDKTTFKPKDGEDHLTIMWTNTMSPKPGNIWCPNHFVPLVSPDCIRLSQIENVHHSTPVPCNQTIQTNCKSSAIKRQSFDLVEQSDKHEELDSCNLPKKCPRYSDSEQFVSRNRFECLSDIASDDDENVTDSETPNEECALKDAPLADKFMSNENMLQVLIQTQQPSKHIPVGKKNNKFIVVENNLDNKTDDRGVWDSSEGTSNNQSFLVNMSDGTDTPQLKTLFKRAGMFVNRKRVNGVARYEVLDPQPLDNILTIHRYYAKLKHDLDYRKRVTTITDAPATLQHLTKVSLIEYAGTQTQNVRPLHGNSKHNRQPYIRTNPETLKKCATIATLKPATEVCYEE